MVDQIKDPELYQSIFESSAQAILVADDKGMIIRVNHALESLFGYDLGELDNLPIEILIPQEKRKTHRDLQKKYAKAPKSRPMGKVDILGLKKDGEQISLDISLNPSTVNDKKVVIAFVTDNTERMNDQKARIINEKRLAEAHSVLHTRNRALEAAGNGIVIVEAKYPELPIIYSNKAFTEITGYSYEEVLGLNCQFLQNDDRDQEAIMKMDEAIKKGEACKVVARNYRKNGSLFWNEISITPLFDEIKQLTHFIGVLNDVTNIHETKNQLENYTEKLEQMVEDRTIEIKSTLEKLVEANTNLEDQIISTKAAVEKARASQEMFIAIAQNFPKGVIVVFNTNFELVYIEGEELDRINLKKSEIEGVKVDELLILTPLQKLKLKEDIKNTLAGLSISAELDFNGQNYAVNSTPLFGDNRKIIWALFVYNNVTEQKNVQQKLEASLKVEQQLNELKSRFISMASHEFRTPLSAILSSAILIGKQNEAGKEERRLKHVFRIRNNVKNLVVILNDFLSLSKLEEGKVVATPHNFELIEFSKLVIEEMEATKKEGQQILFNPTETEIFVYQDQKLLNHILINLLSNAIKYSDENQQIILKIVTTKKHIILKIIDEGIGIPKEEHEKLFERFFRAANATNIQGTGLGLHIVKQYVELMGGTVSFTSETGKGSSFSVKLPLIKY